MKKIISGIFVATLLLGIGTEVFANSGEGKGTFNFGQMLPFMQEMHPNLSQNELKEMYNSCHGTNGAAPSNSFNEMNPQGMMNNF